MEVLYSAGSEAAILVWVKQQRGYSRSFEYKQDTHRVIVLLLDRGSGVYLDEIYVYCMSDDEEKWRLVLFRVTHTKVTVEEKGGNLVFKAENGDIILEQSLNVLTSFFGGRKR